MRILFALAFAILAALPARASEELVLGLSEDQVAINVTFDGSDLLVFGAVKRDTPIPAGDPIGVIMAIEGPSLPVTVRRKEKKWGIWINTDSLEISSAPAFYAVATSGPFADVLKETEDQRYHITIPTGMDNADIAKV